MSYAPPTPGPSTEPTTRSRTLLFRSYRDSLPRTSRFSRAKHRASFQYDNTSVMEGDDERQGLIKGNGLGAEEGFVALDLEEGLPPKWVDIAEDVEEILAETKLKVAALDKLHAKHALPGFSDRTAEEREIEALTNEVTRNFRTAQTLIQRISSSSYPPYNTKDTGKNRAEETAAKNVQRGLAAKVQGMSGVFRKKQRVYMDKLQGHATKNQDLLIASGTISNSQVEREALYAVDEDVQATAFESNPSSTLVSRTQELTHLATSITELADLFKDLSALVIDQGTLLDSVEYNIEMVRERVEDGAKELVVAAGYQKNSGRRRCIFLLLLIIFGLIVVLIVKPKRQSSSSPSLTHPPLGPSVSLDPSPLPTLSPPAVRWSRRSRHR